MLVRGAGDRGLCAGGDIVAIYRDMLDGGDATADFWADEYRLNLLISEYPKPYVAFMDGLVLGGGVGISAHGSVRIVTERTRTGMPETTIGFVPDVGGTLLLSRSPGETGTHAALTGAHLSGADALFLGLADHFVPSDRLAELAAALETEPAEAAVARFAEPAPPSVLAAQQEWIDACYSSDDAEEILRRLRAGGRGSGRRRRHHRGQVADRGEGGAGIPAPGPRAEPGRRRSNRSTAWACASSPDRTSAKASAPRWWTRTAIPAGSPPPWRRSPGTTSRPTSPRWADRELKLSPKEKNKREEHMSEREAAPETGTIAFLGLGHMGGPMAVNLVKAGYKVTGFDVVPAALDAAREHGIPTAGTAAEAAAGAAVVLTMLPSGKHLLDAYRGTGGAARPA